MIVAVNADLCNCVKKPEKKIQDFYGVWTRDLAIPVRCSTNWDMKPLMLGAGQLWVHMFPWKKLVLMIYEINHMNCVNEMKMKKRSSKWTQFMQLRKEAWKKFRTSTGFEPVTSRYWCDALPTELRNLWRWEQGNWGFICSREKSEC